MNGASLYGALPIPLQNLACTYAGWRRARLRYTPYFHKTLASWMESGWSSREALLTLQQDRRIYSRNADVVEVTEHDSKAARKASDHLPVLATVSRKPEAI